MATMANAPSLPETIAIAIGKGKKRKEVVKALCDSGVNQEVAQMMVDTAVKNYPAAVRSGALAQMGSGAVLFVAGLVITVGTYAMASSGGTGGFYLISWGPMLFGAIRVLRGLFRLVTA